MYTKIVRQPCLLLRVINVLSLITLIILPVSAQNIDMEEVYARDEFRWGVRSFNSGNFSKAIISFENSLAYKPQNTLTREWLGKAYYRGGFVNTALGIWESIIKEKKATALLQNKYETISAQLGLGKELSEKMHYVISLEITGNKEDYSLFSKPSSVATRADGSFFLVAYGSNEVLQFNANGALQKRLRGGFQVFDHPFDVLDTGEGFLFVSEFEGNRIARCNYDGYITDSFGERGSGDGQLLGPQYMAADGKGYIYVTDWGNRRVCKFDYEGNFILSFGKRNLDFPGFLAPSGILCFREKIFVSDAMRRHIAVFDLSGNFIGILGSEVFHGPEGLAVFDSDEILVADTDRLVSLNIDTELVSVVSDLENSAGKVLKAETDINGNIIAADFDNNGIIFLSEISSIYSGLFVQIDSVYSGNFPNVVLSARVQDRLGSPISGLDASNFIITEGGYSIQDYSFEFTTDDSRYADITVLIENSPRMEKYADQVRQVVLELINDIKSSGSMRMVSAGEIPMLIAGSDSKDREFVSAAVGETSIEKEGKFDQGIRMSVGELISSKNKRAIVFLSSGSLGENAFSEYDLLQTMHYMKNNSVQFYSIYLGSAASSVEELEYLCRETGGKSYHFFEPSGIGTLIDDISLSRNGMYVFTFRSARNPDFGRAYLPLELEVLLLKRSGRDESGYFAPLEF